MNFLSRLSPVLVLLLSHALGQEQWKKTDVRLYSEHLTNTSLPQPNNACRGVQMSFTNSLGPNARIRGFWLTHKASTGEQDTLAGAYELRDGETSEKLSIDSGSGARDYWSFAAIIDNFKNGEAPILAYYMRKSCQLYCPDDDHSTINIDIQCTSTPCKSIKMQIPMKSGGCSQTVEFIQPDITKADSVRFYSSLDEFVQPTTTSQVDKDVLLPNSDCSAIFMFVRNDYSYTIGSFVTHRATSQGSFSYLIREDLVKGRRSSEGVSVTSNAGDSDYWSLAIVGAKEFGEPYVAYRMNRSCQLYCPEDEGLKTALTLDANGKKFEVPMKSSGCSFAVTFEEP